jgi:hypothetical protein
MLTRQHTNQNTPRILHLTETRQVKVKREGNPGTTRAPRRCARRRAAARGARPRTRSRRRRGGRRPCSCAGGPCHPPCAVPPPPPPPAPPAGAPWPRPAGSVFRVYVSGFAKPALLPPAPPAGAPWPHPVTPGSRFTFRSAQQGTPCRASSDPRPPQAGAAATWLLQPVPAARGGKAKIIAILVGQAARLGCRKAVDCCHPGMSSLRIGPSFNQHTDKQQLPPNSPGPWRQRSQWRSG